MQFLAFARIQCLSAAPGRCDRLTSLMSVIGPQAVFQGLMIDNYLILLYLSCRCDVSWILKTTGCEA